MRLLALQFSAIVLGATSPAFASDWRIVSESAFATQFVDASSLVIDGTRRLAWFKYVFANPDPYIDNWRSREEIDCKLRRRRTLTTLTYAGERNLGHIVVDENKWVDLPPDSIGETKIAMVCSMVLRKRT